MSNDNLIQAAELLPCPFCGHIGLDFHEGSTFRWLVAECIECGASRGETRIQTIGNGTKENWLLAAKIDAIKEWNTRAALAEAKMPAEQQVEQEPVVKVVATMMGIFPVWFDGEWHRNLPKHGDGREQSLYTHPQRVKAEPLTRDQVDDLLNVTYEDLVKEGFNGGMAGVTWDHAVVKATEIAHGIGQSQQESKP